MKIEYRYNMSLRSWNIKVIREDGEWIENAWLGNPKDVRYLIKQYKKKYNILKQDVVKYKKY